ncbi:hypothetical protein CEXT_469651 [Caerostris extrusa]|uniref:Uncharacterized protein n=1 Tax=Caerostris extrusa TaxID=172846 RepID=A0AAV4VYG6_CAEEX|nr:hypothetical protein CEXT_469651 [Caerostris extrusa]
MFYWNPYYSKELSLVRVFVARWPSVSWCGANLGLKALDSKDGVKLEIFPLQRKNEIAGFSHSTVPCKYCISPETRYILRKVNFFSFGRWRQQNFLFFQFKVELSERSELSEVKIV